jgi:hypothetical protein
MILCLLIAAQVATSTAAPPKLSTPLERALWSAYVEERTARRVAERELSGARLELEARARRVAALETLTGSIARGLGAPAQACDCPAMTPTGGLICGGIALGAAIAGGVLGRESCGPIVIPLGSSP